MKTGQFTSLAFAFTAIVGSSSATAQERPPIRELGPPVAITSEPLMNVAQVRALPGGRVLVNDTQRRRVLLFDSTMALIKVVADSAPTNANSYGARAGRLMAYHGDSSLLVDNATLSMLVIDGNGDIVRVRAIPRTEHASYIGGISTAYGWPGFDAQGRLIYRINDPFGIVRVATGGGVVAPEAPDSAPVLRMDMDTRRLDTVAMVKIQKRVMEPTRLASGGYSYRTLTNPMPVQDDWAVMKDGSLALIRHRDYHIDWVNPDGSRTSSPPIPFDWQRMSDDHRRAFVDSVRHALEESRRMSLARFDSLNFVCFNIPPLMTPISDSGPPSAAPPQARPAPPPQNCPISPYPVASMFATAPAVVPWDAIPDYKPPFPAAAARGDEDNNLWIRVNQMQPVPGTVHYDIVNRQGVLTDRIQIVASRTLVGFGPGGIVYLLSRTPAGVVLERVRWRD